jgi:hypothetical protein
MNINNGLNGETTRSALTQSHHEFMMRQIYCDESYLRRSRWHHYMVLTNGAQRPKVCGIERNESFARIWTEIETISKIGATHPL